MSDRELARQTILDWCGSAAPDTAKLADLWSAGHGAGFIPEGVATLIVRTKTAFGQRADKRRVLFLKTNDFNNRGWKIGTTADFLDFITDHTEDRVAAVVTAWAGIDGLDDTSVTVCSLWAVNHGSACSFGIPDLIDRIVKEFRELKISLRPEDFDPDNDIQTVDDLIRAVAGSPSRLGGDA